MPNYPLKNRTALWQQLQADSKNSSGENGGWDMVVVGGGITGAGILREAAKLGLKVLLVEQQDFAWGTSSRSSKMVHGGIRYLAMGDFSLTRHSLMERERLLGEAPGLVDRMGYYFTLSKSEWLPAIAVKVLLWIYDRIAGISDHKSVPLKKLGSHFRGMNLEALKGAFYYTDAVTDDSRLVQRVIQEAVNDNGAALNYVKVTGLLQSGSGRIGGVCLRDEITQQCVDVRSSVVVNATGAWADRLRNELNDEKRVRPQRGSHLVVSGLKLPVKDAITLSHPDDKRKMFIYPWENRTVIGTTDLDHRVDLDSEASITTEEVSYLIRAANFTFPNVELKEQDIISTWAGIRPIIASEKSRDPSKERRDHAVWTDQNLVTVSGGKLTTFRLIALDVLKAAAKIIPDKISRLDQLQKDRGARVFSATTVESMQLLPKDSKFALQLIGRYGDAAAQVVALGGEDETAPIMDSRFCLAECRWALREESVQHLDDLLLRRTRLGLVLESGAAELLPRLQLLCAQELNWGDERWEEEVQRYQALWRAHYFLPRTRQS